MRTLRDIRRKWRLLRKNSSKVGTLGQSMILKLCLKKNLSKTTSAILKMKSNRGKKKSSISLKTIYLKYLSDLKLTQAILASNMIRNNLVSNTNITRTRLSSSLGAKLTQIQADINRILLLN